MSENKGPINREKRFFSLCVLGGFIFVFLCCVVTFLKAHKIWNTSRLRLEMTTAGNGQHSQHWRTGIEWYHRFSIWRGDMYQWLLGSNLIHNLCVFFSTTSQTNQMKGLEEPEMDPKSRDLLVQQASQCLSKLVQIASRTKRNFILDQVLNW